MYPEDRVLVAYVPQPTDFERMQEAGWYRIPQRHAPKGLHAEYIAFYFGRRFGPEKWAIHYYAQNLGHELVTRAQLFPEQPDHPRAEQYYYKIQLGLLQRLDQPILSLRWRRITFVHTTWDRFLDAKEINDLFIEGEPYVDRLYAVLKEQGIRAERDYRVEEAGESYVVPLSVVCRNGRVNIHSTQLPQTAEEIAAVAANIIQETEEKGGVKN